MPNPSAVLPVFLIVACEQQPVDTWRNWLVGSATLSRDPSDAASAELVITDQWPLADETWRSLPAEIKILYVGTATAEPHQPDVQLPNPTQRELQLACRLLRQVHRLEAANRCITDESRQWQESAHTDSLTKLPNRRFWRATLADLDLDQPHGILLIDLDDFKQVNDLYGHAGGDQVLIETATALRSAARDTDLIVRLSGDEFAVLLRPFEWESGQATAEGFRRAVCDAAATPTRTASAGLAFPGKAQLASWSEIVGEADLALLKAKQQGKNRLLSVEC